MALQLPIYLKTILNAVPGLGHHGRRLDEELRLVVAVVRPGVGHVVQHVAARQRVPAHKTGNVLFNDALNTFYLRLYGIRHMVEDHSDSERRNPLPLHKLLFLINSKGSFICTIPETGLHIPRPLLHQSWSTGCAHKHRENSVSS